MNLNPTEFIANVEIAGKRVAFWFGAPEYQGTRQSIVWTPDAVVIDARLCGRAIVNLIAVATSRAMDDTQLPGDEIASMVRIGTKLWRIQIVDDLPDRIGVSFHHYSGTMLVRRLEAGEMAVNVARAVQDGFARVGRAA